MFSRLLIVLVCLASTLSSIASTDAIDSARENCSRVESSLNVALGCDVQINCLFNTATINCSELTLIQLVQTCRDFDIQTCVDVAALTTIAIDDAILQFQTIDSTVQLNNSLRAFLDGDYQTAIDLYENITLSLDYFPHHILELGLGILYLRFDNPDVALIQFDKSLNLEFYNPVAFYYRGNTYEERGNSIRALRDHYLYDLLADTQLKIRLPLRSFRIQIPNSEAWSRYPIYTMGGINEAFSIADNTLEPLEPIVVSFVDDGETLVIADWLDIVASNEAEILFFERDPQSPLRYILNINQQNVPNSVLSGKTEVSVVVSPGYLDLYVRSTQGTITILTTSLATVALESDRRIDNANRICDLASLSFMDVGIEVEILASSQASQLWESPDFDSISREFVFTEDEETKPFTVVDGGLCDSSAIWWEISNGTEMGWLPEHQYLSLKDYQLVPSDLYQLWQETPPTPLQFLDG